MTDRLDRLSSDRHHRQTQINRQDCKTARLDRLLAVTDRLDRLSTDRHHRQTHR